MIIILLTVFINVSGILSLILVIKVVKKGIYTICRTKALKMESYNFKAEKYL